MAFSIEITLNGILAFCRHPGGSGIRVLVPDTLFGHYDDQDVFHQDGEGRKAIDGEPLKRHYPRFNAGQDTFRRLRFLRNEQLSFEFAFENAEHGFTEELLTLPSMPEIDPQADLDSTALHDPAGSPLVTNHLDITVGSLQCRPAQRWRIPGPLRGSAAGDIEQCFATAVVWRISGLDAATARTLPYDGGPGKSWDLTMDTEGIRQLSIVNHCSEPWQPLPAGTGTREPDDDFRWHYELMSGAARTRIASTLGVGTDAADTLPILLPVEGECGGQGAADEKRITFLAPQLDPNGVEKMFNPPRGNCMGTKWF